jgi:hypothetical protein
MHTKNNKKGSSSISNKGVNSPATTIAYLPRAQKLIDIRALPAKERFDRIISEPEARYLVHALDPHEVYWLLKDVGESDSLELLELCSPEQELFFLDMECWEKDKFSTESFLEWLGYLLETGEKKIIELLQYLDMEFLSICLMRTITVEKAIDDTFAKVDMEVEWDHSFDDTYYISFRDAAHASLVGRFIEIIYRNTPTLYTALMESTRAEIPQEIEELSYQFRKGRLADLGFPAYEDAISIFAYVDPAKYVPMEEKRLYAGPREKIHDLTRRLTGDSLLKRVLAAAKSEGLVLEFNCLINSAIAATGRAPSDGKEVQAVFERVHGYLNIALEFLCGENQARAVEVLKKEQLKRLFQVGRSVTISLRKAAQRLDAENRSLSYASSKTLLGLKADYPRFYRALDPDMADGYREFRDLGDVRKMESFLKEFEN